MLPHLKKDARATRGKFPTLSVNSIFMYIKYAKTMGTCLSDR